MVNPHQQSQCENTNISPGRHQYEGDGTDDFDKGHKCGYDVNYFWYYGDNLYQYGSKRIYNLVRYSENQCDI